MSSLRFRFDYCVSVTTVYYFESDTTGKDEEQAKGGIPPLLLLFPLMLCVKLRDLALQVIRCSIGVLERELLQDNLEGDRERKKMTRKQGG